MELRLRFSVLLAMILAGLCGNCFLAGAEPPPIMHNGQPFFPILDMTGYPGTYLPGRIQNWNSPYEHMDLEAASGFNTIYFPLAWEYYNNKICLDRCSQYNMTMIAKDSVGFNAAPGTSDNNLLMNAINAVKGHPALLMYATEDEPYARAVTGWFGSDPLPVYSNLQSSLSMANSLDSNHPVYLNEVAYYPFSTWDDFSGNQWYYWSLLGNIYSQDCYPIGGSGSGNPADVGRCIDKQIEITGGTKPVMIICQGQGANEWDNDPNNNGPRPTAAQTRFMPYDAVIHGAKGVGWWGTQWLEPTDELWLSIKRVAGELNYLQNALVRPRILSGFALGHADLEGAMWTYGGNHFLIVANKTANTRNNITINATGVGWHTTSYRPQTTVLFEGRTVNSPNDTWTDSFSPWAVHVYTDKDMNQQPGTTVYDYQETAFLHNVGYAITGGWRVLATTPQGYMIYGPYVNNLPTDYRLTARFWIREDNTTANNSDVCYLDVYDTTANAVLCSTEVYRMDMDTPYVYQPFDLTFDAPAGHFMEFRMYHRGLSMLDVDRVQVLTGVNPTYQETSFSHQTGSAISGGWRATVLNPAGYMLYGPYTSQISGGTWNARFWLREDNNTFDNSNTCRIEVFDYTSNTLLASRLLYRRDWSQANVYLPFNLSFTNVAGHQLEFRVYHTGLAMIDVDKVEIL